MESKINYLWRQFEEHMTVTQGRVLSDNAIQTYKACFYAGAFACAWRINKHLTARGKDDQWMAELMVELEDAIHQQGAALFEEQVQ